MPGHVKGDHTEVFRDAAVVQQAAILAGVGTCRVHAKQRNALSGFLNIQAMRFSQQVAAQVGHADLPAPDPGHRGDARADACGEAAIAAQQLLAIKERVLRTNLAEAQPLAQRVLRQSDPAKTRELIAKLNS